MINSELLTWDEADEKCKSNGGYLASIQDRFEQYWLNTNLENEANKWIGLKKQYYDYKWSNSDEFTYSNWDISYPDIKKGKCVAMSSTGFWKNIDCKSKLTR